MLYNSYSGYLRKKYGKKVRRISLDAGFPCPGGGDGQGERCIFCNESAFTRYTGGSVPLSEQIELSMERERARAGDVRFIAYFQNATNTNADVEELKTAYDTVKGYPDIVGISIATRPDCIDDDKLELIKGYAASHEVWVEYGLQTAHDVSLDYLNRRHTYAQSVRAVIKTASRGINVGAHVILGLPSETRDDMIRTAREISSLPVHGVKLHVLHVLRDTRLEAIFHDGGLRLMEREEYVRAACDFLENLRKDCVVLRLVSDAKDDVLVAPGWINAKQTVIGMIEGEFMRRKTFQGAKA